MLTKNMFWGVSFLAFACLIAACKSVSPLQEIREKNQEERAESYFQKGFKAEQERQKEVAILYYTMAINIQPNFIAAYYHRANNYFDANQNEQAIRDYSEVLKIQDHYKNAYFNRSLSYLSIGNTHKALSDLLALLEKNPKDLDAHKYAGIIYWDYLSKPKEADFHFRQYLSLEGDDQRVKQWLTKISEKKTE